MLVSSAARYLWLALLASVLIHLSGCSSTGESEYKSVKQTSSDSTFPIPPGIEDNVEFWRKVYGEMDRSQVVIHDNEYMSVTYEVIQVPGSGESRRAFVKGKQQEYRDRLAILERKVTYGESLTSAEEEMKAQLEAVGGRNAIFGAADRVRTQQGMRERFRSGMEISGRYDQAFREIFRKHGVPEDLAFLPHVESSFQSQARSGVGAAGLWQFMPATGRVYSLQVDHKLDERMDPLLACEGAARYLSAAHRKLGSWPLAITSYNHGQGGIAKAKSQHGSDIGKIVENYKGESFGFDSRNFYSQFVAAREVAGNPKKYFPDGVAFHKAHDSDRLVLKQPMSAQQLAGSYGLSVNQLDDLNPSWSNAIVKGNASIPAGASVWLPAGTTERASGQPGASAPAMVARQEKAESASAFEPESEFISVTRVTRPEPVLARAGAKPVVARSDVRTDTRARTAIAKAEIQAKPDFDMDAPKPRSANLRSDTKAKTSLAMADPKAEPDKVLPKTHVVKANETLFQVAVKYDISMDELKKLNKLSAKDNTIKTGQKLRVKVSDDPKAAAKGKAEAKPAPTLAKADPKSGKDKSNKGKAEPAKAPPKTHVVKANETLFQVAVKYDTSVDELKKLNKLSAKDNTIKTGQKLKVSG
ncbi:MAG: LysM peptidoglycan-binding domain-containing protein [Chromatiaceae bacterium]|nr:LysM peptidoglycan-binding domain-containing protein [Chromatiaceae bacterium]MBP8282690.1 LysM peptidoglycan-binding domain-containing protein [Chromatiaceae bacterium]